tara:strand:+ start:291 stop:512 length:222 start_codon:yes stop_codon:yes gene_type:complete
MKLLLLPLLASISLLAENKTNSIECESIYQNQVKTLKIYLNENQEKHQNIIKKLTKYAKNIGCYNQITFFHKY